MFEEWREEASCAFLTIDEKLWFFGDAEDGLSVEEQHLKAALICFECPVQLDCLRWSIRSDVREDVWGGLTSSQRKRYVFPLARSRRPAAYIDDILKDAIFRVEKRLCKYREDLLASKTHSSSSSETGVPT